MFSSQLSQWLSRYHRFVNAGKLVSDPLAGRALGAASGNLWDAYPFLAPCSFSGVFAGLSVSGFESTVRSVRLRRYLNRSGFTPCESGPFAGNLWQQLTGEDWCRIDPLAFPAISEIPTPYHPLDLALSIDETEYNTSGPDWKYSTRELTPRHRLHSWHRENGISVTAVVFTSCCETSAPFLRPCHIVGDVEIDPVCLFPLKRMIRLFSGITILAPGTDISLFVEQKSGDEDMVSEETQPTAVNTVVTINKAVPAKIPWLKSLSGVTPDMNGNLSLSSTGSHKITQRYFEVDSDTGLVTLEPHSLYILSDDRPCCSCEEYVAAYETLRELYRRHDKLLETYNELYARIKQARDTLEKRCQEQVKSVRVRRDKTVTREENGKQVVECEVTLIYSNIRDVEYEHPNVTLKIVPDSGTISLLDAKITRLPESTELKIVDFGADTIRFSSCVLPSMSHKAAKISFAASMLSGATFSITAEIFQ